MQSPPRLPSTTLGMLMEISVLLHLLAVKLIGTFALVDWRGERRRIFVDTDMHGISQIFSLASSQGDGDQQSAPSLLLFSKPGRKLLGLSGASSPTRICSLDDRILDMFSLGVALLAVSEDRVQAISWQDGSILATLILPTPGSCLTCTAVTVGGASGSTLVALGMADKTICLVEATLSKGSVAGGSVTLATRQHQGQPLPPLKGITGEPSCLAISPDGRWLAVGDTQRRVHLFDLATNEVWLALPSFCITHHHIRRSPPNGAFTPPPSPAWPGRPRGNISSRGALTTPSSCGVPRPAAGPSPNFPVATRIPPGDHS